MSPVGDAAFDRQMALRVEQLDADYRRELPRTWDGIPAGHVPVDDITWAAQFERKEFEAGWGIVTDKTTGAQQLVNLFTFSLEQDNVNGGKQLLARYIRIRGKVA